MKHRGPAEWRMSRGSSLNFVRDRDKLEQADERNDSYYSRKETVCLAMRDISSLVWQD